MAAMETVYDDALASAGGARRADGTLDLTAALRSLLEGLVNAVMDEQAGELCALTGTSRNGYRERSLDTQVGRVTLRIPKLREGTYFPDDIVRRWSRCDTALAAAALEMWVGGVSTRKVERAMAELGVEEMSRSRVSRLAAALDEQVAQLREGDLSAHPWPYLWLDATYVPCREAGAARSRAVVVAVAAGCPGAGPSERRVVGLACIDVESYPAWREFLLSLRRRGLSGVRLVTSDAHEGLVRAVREVMLGAAWQRCVAHFLRNVSDAARTRAGGAAAAAALRAALSESDPALVRAGWDRAAGLVRAADGRWGDLVDSAREDVLAYLALPRGHRHWVRTNNVCERLNGELKRRARVVQVFPSAGSLVRLVGAVCCEQNDGWEGASNFIDARSLRAVQDGSWEPPDSAPEPAEAERVARLVEEAFDRRARAA
jgi:putative transposase